MWDTPFDPDAGFEAAARVLCSAQYLEHEQGGGVWTTDDEATFTRLGSTHCLTHEHSVHAYALTSMQCFELAFSLSWSFFSSTSSRRPSSSRPRSRSAAAALGLALSMR